MSEPICPMCDEVVDADAGDVCPVSLHTEDGPKIAHRSCMLREVTGGIGHLVAHDYWCVKHHDPDAGLTYRQSALLVDVWVSVVGAHQAVPNDA